LKLRMRSADFKIQAICVSPRWRRPCFEKQP
jgi:hypothetical protein